MEIQALQNLKIVNKYIFKTYFRINRYEKN